MNRRMLRMSLAIGIGLVVGVPCSAQDRTTPLASPSYHPPSNGTRIAVVDIRQVFSEFHSFQQRINLITDEVKAFDKQVKQEQQTMLQQRDQLTKLNSGDETYRRLEASLMQQVSQAQIRAELKRKDIVEKEAHAYFESYRHILAAIEAIARANDIGLVLKQEAHNMDPHDRPSVLAGVNRTIVHQANLDITSDIIAMINQK